MSQAPAEQIEKKDTQVSNDEDMQGLKRKREDEPLVGVDENSHPPKRAKKKRLPYYNSKDDFYIQIKNIPTKLAPSLESVVDQLKSQLSSDGLIIEMGAPGQSVKMDVELVKGERVLLKPETSLIKEQRKAYRREYRNRPESIRKREEKNKDPDVIQKRKLYCQKEEVKKRKRFLALQKKTIVKLAKEENPALYEKALKVARAEEGIGESSKSSDTSDTSSEE